MSYPWYPQCQSLLSEENLEFACVPHSRRNTQRTRFISHAYTHRGRRNRLGTCDGSIARGHVVNYYSSIEDSRVSEKAVSIRRIITVQPLYLSLL